MEAGSVTSFTPQVPSLVRSFNYTFSGKCADPLQTHTRGKIEHTIGATALKVGRVVVYNTLWLLAHIEQSLSRKNHAHLIAFFSYMMAASRLLPLNTERLVKCLNHLDQLNLAPEGKQRIAQLILDQIVPAKLSKDLLLDLMVFLGNESEKQRSYPKFIQNCFERLDELRWGNNLLTGTEAYHLLFPILQFCKNDTKDDFRISECLWIIENSESQFSEQELLSLFFALIDSRRESADLRQNIFLPLIKWLPKHLTPLTFDECCQRLPLALLDYKHHLRAELFYQITSRLQNKDCSITPEQAANFLIELRFLTRNMDVDFSKLTPVLVEYWEKEVAQLETMNAQELVEFIKLQYQLIYAPYALKNGYSHKTFDNDNISSAIIRRMSSLNKQFTLEQIGECLPRISYSLQEDPGVDD